MTKISNLQSGKNKLIRLCHRCGKCHETEVELERCPHCQKSFLPSLYFQKIHDEHQKYQELFSHAQEIQESDLIKGVAVLWTPCDESLSKNFTDPE
ncbi:MAG: hypothetical protein QE271_05980 [Bacteriovoracaceae bacterium]|nr:hypothetical protein [Bacteriovoracaceae bacterium]